jgi:hypothetical protein
MFQLRRTAEPSCVLGLAMTLWLSPVGARGAVSGRVLQAGTLPQQIHERITIADNRVAAGRRVEGTLTIRLRNPRDLLAGEPSAFIALLEAARPAPVSMEDMGAILRALPPEGEVTKLGAPAQQKVDAVRQLLRSTRRDWYEIKVIDLPQAAIGLHARAVVLISAPAIALVNAAELQAMVAHEIGHEYVWTEWHRARQHTNQERLKELELVCDAIAAVTLRQLGMDPSIVIDAIENVTRFNRQRFGAAIDENNYPTLGERRAFVRQICRWLQDSRW